MKIVFDVEPGDVVEFAQILLRNRLEHRIVDAKDHDDDDDENEDNDGFVSIQVEITRLKPSEAIIKKLRGLSKDEDEEEEEEEEENDD